MKMINSHTLQGLAELHSISLGKAGELAPGWECHAFMEFTRTDLEIETGLICQSKGDQSAAELYPLTIHWSVANNTNLHSKGELSSVGGKRNV